MADLMDLITQLTPAVADMDEKEAAKDDAAKALSVAQGAYASAAETVVELQKQIASLLGMSRNDRVRMG